MINMHRVETVSDAKDYISRLKEIKRVFNEKMDFLRKQEAKGIVPPDFVFDKVIKTARISSKAFLSLLARTVLSWPTLKGRSIP